MGKLTYFCLTLATISAVGAQSATNFQPKVPDLGRSASASATNAPPAAPEDLTGTATLSRYIPADSVEHYVKSVAAIFMIRDKEKDPFGQYQDAEVVPEVKLATSSNRPAAIQATPFSEIVALLPIKIVMARDQSFFVKQRKFRQGGIIPLSFRGKTINAQVIKVTSSQIVLRHPGTGETTTKEFSSLPAGMTRGNKNNTVPGMSIQQPDAPIELDSNDDAP